MLENRELLESKRKEYDMLRREIEDIMKTQTTLFNICITAVAGVIALCVSESNPHLTFTVHIVIFFILLRYLRIRHGFLYLSAYMIVYLEPLIGIEWETNNYTRYLLEKTNTSKLQLLYNKPRHLIWVALSAISFITYLIISWESLHAATILLHIICMIAILYQSIELANADYVREKEVNEWFNLKFQIHEKSKQFRNMICDPSESQTNKDDSGIL